MRIGCIVVYFAPFIGLGGIMNHYQAETMPLDVENWKYVNNTENQQFHYWNNITDTYQNVSVSEIFRANNKFSGERDIPPTTLYTLIQLQTAYILFLVFYLVFKWKAN